MIKPYIWKSILGVANYAQSPYMILNFITSVIIVFTVCGIIEYIRMKIFKLFERTKISKLINKKIEKIDDNICIIMEENT